MNKCVKGAFLFSARLMRLHLGLCCLFLSSHSCAHSDTHLSFQQPHLNDLDYLSPAGTRRVAIIGGGAAGSSAAYFLRQEYDKRSRGDNEKRLEITLFEQSDAIGGRVRHVDIELIECVQQETTWIQQLECYWKGCSSQPSVECGKRQVLVEQGASMFASINAHLMNATALFKLNTTDLEQVQSNDKPSRSPKVPRFGVWDGEAWRFLESNASFGRNLLTKIRFLWRYGLTNGPTYVSGMAKELSDKFIHIYDYLIQGQGFVDVPSMTEILNTSYALLSTARDFYTEKKVSKLFLDDIVGGIVKANYGSGLDQIHAFGAQVAVYAGFSQVYSIELGNTLLFEKMAEFADRIEFNTTVTRVMKKDRGFVVEQYHKNAPLYDTFDHVIVAVPQPSSIQFEGLPQKSPQNIPYVTVYSTIVVGLPSLSYFNLNSYDEFPEDILIPDSAHCPFNAFQIVEWINATLTEQDSLSAVVKVFSPERLSTVELDTLFASRTMTTVKPWKAYPYLSPKPPQWKAPFVLDPQGVYYVNRMEEWISTMETETIASRNAVNLLLSQWETESS